MAKPDLRSLNCEKSHAVLEIYVREFGGCCSYIVSLCADPGGNRETCTAIWGECVWPQINPDLTTSYVSCLLNVLLGFGFIAKSGTITTCVNMFQLVLL